MSWSRLGIARAATLALVVAGVASGTAAQAATMVVRASGPVAAEYPPGKSLADSARIRLGATDSVTLLDAKGTRTLKGPGVFSPLSAPNAVASGTGSTLAALVTTGGEKRARIGAVRGAVFGNPMQSPNLWYANVGKSATVCVADPAALTMWRPGGSDAAEARISGAGRSETVQWIKGQTIRAWPATLPVADGRIYTVGWQDGTTTMLRFAVVGAQAAAGGLQDMATTLIRHGCQAQLDQLIDTASVPPAGASAG